MSPSITYYFVSLRESSTGVRSHVSSLKKWIRKVLNDQEQGIPHFTGMQYREVHHRDDADIVVSLNIQADIDAECGFSKLSCSLVLFDEKDGSDRILFSFENWMGESDWDGDSLEDYRTYLINHEFLHCRPFRLDHPDEVACKDDGVPGKLPVMYQQSRGRPSESCEHNPWPLKSEFPSF